MGLSEDVVFLRRSLRQLAEKSDPMFLKGVAGGGGVPPEMFDGEVNEDGWVGWRILPSTLTSADVSDLESDFAIELPPLFRAYLLAIFTSLIYC